MLSTNSDKPFVIPPDSVNNLLITVSLSLIGTEVCSQFADLR